MDICQITLGTRPFVHVHVLSEVTRVKVEAWKSMFNDRNQPAVCTVRTKDGLYIEESSASLLVRLNTAPGILKAWEEWLNKNGSRRRLTESEKKYVAASQGYKCGQCDRQLGATYEVDHIEPHFLRANNRRSNLVALCPNCHRRKTVEDFRYGDPCFDSRPYQAKVISIFEKNGNFFSAYFHKPPST